MTDAEKLVLYCKILLIRRNIPFRGWFLGYDECDQPNSATGRYRISTAGAHYIVLYFKKENQPVVINHY
jgi:hypothetical protein